MKARLISWLWQRWADYRRILKQRQARREDEAMHRRRLLVLYSSCVRRWV